MPANQKQFCRNQQIGKYQYIMSIHQEPRQRRQRKQKEPKPSQAQIVAPTPQKLQAQPKTLNLRDLSPYSPMLRTVKKSYDLPMLHHDLAMIETPVGTQNQKSLIDEVEGRNNLISRLLVWERDDEEDEVNNSGSVEGSVSSNASVSNDEICQQNENVENSAKKISDMQSVIQSKFVQKEGQKQKSPKTTKKSKERPQKVQPNPQKRKITCNCKKTKCLKLYCDCFHENQVCGPECNCVGCHNTDQYQEERYNSMLSLMERNPQAFRPRLEEEQHAKGCNCKKSGCLKKYCECYQAGLGCGQHCKCEDCKNSKMEKSDREVGSKGFLNQE